MTPKDAPEILQPHAHYVNLDHAGVAQVLEGGEAFWAQSPQELDRLGKGWLVAEFLFQHDWPTWEMHPEGDELVYVLEGSATLLLEEAGEVRRITVDGPGLVVVPRGVWHTAQIHRPSRFLHITRGQGTELRAA